MSVLTTTAKILFAASFLACKTSTQKKPMINNAGETIAVKTFLINTQQKGVSVEATGILSSENDIKYAFKIGGVVNKIFVNEGAYFKKGQLLATLKLDEIDAGYAQAKLGLDKAGRDLKRVTNLYKDSVATLEQLQNTQTAYAIAQKQLEGIAFNKDYTKIYASNDGFVIKKLANEGEIVASGMPIVAVSDNQPQSWVIKLGLSDKDWAKVAEGDKAQIILDAYPNQHFQGTVFRKLLAADQVSGSFLVDIKLKAGTTRLALGMFGKASIITKSVQAYQSIPYDALVEADGQTAYVFVPLPNGRVKKQAIEIASFNNDFVLVKSGLQKVNAIVVTNTAFLNEQSNITIIQ